MEIVIIIVLAIMLVTFLVLRVGDVFSPWTVTTAVWLAILVMYQFQGKLLDPLSDQFLYCLIIWYPILCISSLATYYVMPSDHGHERSSEIPQMNRTVFNWLYVITMVITPVYVYQILKIVMMFDSADLLNNIRLLAVYGGQGFGFLQYSYVLSQVMVVVAFWQYPKIPFWQLLTIVVAAMMSAFAIMEKGMLFFLFITIIFCLYEKRVIKMRSIIVSIVSIVFGSHTFYYIYIFLVRWGGEFVVYDKLQEFVWVPLPTNVYTVFQPFYLDFGYKGVAVFAMFYGVVSGWCYRQMRYGSGVAKCLYVYITYALVLQFYQENFVLNMVSLIQFIFFIFIIQQRKVTVDFNPEVSQ